MTCKRLSNSFRSGGSTTTSVAAGISELVCANAITACDDNAASLARSTRNASSTAASPLTAAWCNNARYSLA
jgi:hypothetical protein